METSKMNRLEQVYLDQAANHKFNELSMQIIRIGLIWAENSYYGLT